MEFLISNNYDFHWTCQTRFDTVDFPLLKKMREAGCEAIHFGVESGSQRILDNINKNIKIREMKKGMRLTEKAGIKTVCFFMFGLPGETERDMEKTIRLAKELNPTYASFHIAVPYPGTDFYEEIREVKDEETLFPSYYKDKDRLEEIREKAFKSFYLRPKYILSRVFLGDLKLLFQQIKLFFHYLKIGKKEREK